MNADLVTGLWPPMSFRAVQWVGLVTGVVVGGLQADRLAINPDRVVSALTVLIVCGIIGAHVLYAIASGARSLVAIRRRASERSASLWALPIPLAISPLLASVSGLPLTRFGDCAAPALLTASMIGRIACARRGCCCGRPSCSRIAVALTDVAGSRVPRLPTQLIDAAAAAVLGLACFLVPRSLPAGATFCSAMAGFALCRVVTDWTRAGRPRPPALSTTQLALIALCGVALTGALLSFNR